LESSNHVCRERRPGETEPFGSGLAEAGGSLPVCFRDRGPLTWDIRLEVVSLRLNCLLERRNGVVQRLEQPLHGAAKGLVVIGDRDL
jgi:hypothetical protein